MPLCLAPASHMLALLTVTLTQLPWQMPRPKWLEAGASAQVFFNSPVGLCLRRLTLLYQAAYLVRYEVLQGCACRQAT